MIFQYLMPLIDLLLSGAVTYGVTKFLLPKMILQKINEKIISTDFQAYAEPLVEGKIDNFIEQMKLQIPLASMFISNSLIGKLKSQGKEELLKAVPDIKRHLLEKLESHPIDFTPFVWRATFFGAAFGAIIGLINLGLTLWL